MKPHEDWMIDITYIPIQSVDWYLIVLLDVYSRYIVGWELSFSMIWRAVQRVVDFAILSSDSTSLWLCWWVNSLRLSSVYLSEHF